MELAELEEQVPRQVITAGSQLIKETVMRRTPNRLSGVGKRGAKLNVRYVMGSAPGLGGWQSAIFATGPFQLYERDTKPHVIPRQRTGRKRHYAVISGQPFSKVHHPGTKGHHTFEHGTQEAVPKIEAMFVAAAFGAAVKVFA